MALDLASVVKEDGGTPLDLVSCIRLLNTLGPSFLYRLFTTLGSSLLYRLLITLGSSLLYRFKIWHGYKLTYNTGFKCPTVLQCV